MLRVLVCGEGKHDIGMSPGGRSGTWENGWLQILLQRLMTVEIEIVAIQRNALVLQRKVEKKF